MQHLLRNIYVDERKGNLTDSIEMIFLAVFVNSIDPVGIFKSLYVPAPLHYYMLCFIRSETPPLSIITFKIKPIVAYEIFVSFTPS